jgi:hypothetical protein
MKRGLHYVLEGKECEKTTHRSQSITRCSFYIRLRKLMCHELFYIVKQLKKLKRRRMIKFEGSVR